QAEDGIRDDLVTGVQTCALPICWVQINAAAVSDRDGAHHGAILVFHDLTRLKQLENTRQEFVANVSHELRTPLSLIKGFVETLKIGRASCRESVYVLGGVG